MKNHFNRKRAALFAALLVAGMSVQQAAHAALDAAVTTSISTAQTDLVALYTALTGAGVVIWVARIISRRFSVR